MTTDRSTITGTALLAATALAALVGGVLSLGFTTPGLLVGILAVAAATLVGTGLALLLTVAPGRRRPQGLGAWPEPDPGAGGSGRIPADPVPPVADPRPIGTGTAVAAPRIVVPLPAERPPPAAEWWTRTTPGPGGPSRVSAAAPPVRVRPLAEYSSATALIAQCPRCGGFALDVAGSGSGFRFGCRECTYTWSWAPGAPWPAVTVRPERPVPERPGPAEPPRDDRAGPS